MSPTFESLGIGQLSVDERLILVHDIWESISAAAVAAPLTEEQRREIDQRLDAHQANPGTAVPWEQVEAEAIARLRK